MVGMEADRGRMVGMEEPTEELDVAVVVPCCHHPLAVVGRIAWGEKEKGGREGRREGRREVGREEA
jgi:hypothetical protein